MFYLCLYILHILNIFIVSKNYYFFNKFQDNYLKLLKKWLQTITIMLYIRL